MPANSAAATWAGIMTNPPPLMRPNGLFAAVAAIEHGQGRHGRTPPPGGRSAWVATVYRARAGAAGHRAVDVTEQAVDVTAAAETASTATG